MHHVGQAECAYHALAKGVILPPLGRMARKPKTPKDSPYHLRAWRNAKGMTLESVAAELGMSSQNLGKIERGLVDLLPDHLEPLSRIFEIEPADLLRRPADMPAEEPATESVAVVGYVGAGSVATLFAEGQGPFDYVMPPADGTPDTVALNVKGTSLGPAFDESIIFYDDVRSPVTPDLHNRLCVVGLPDGRVLVKMIRPAGDGTFHLFSNTMDEPMLNEPLAWAAKVKGVRPR